MDYNDLARVLIAPLIDGRLTVIILLALLNTLAGVMVGWHTRTLSIERFGEFFGDEVLTKLFGWVIFTELTQIVAWAVWGVPGGATGMGAVQDAIAVAGNSFGTVAVATVYGKGLYDKLMVLQSPRPPLEGLARPRRPRKRAPEPEPLTPEEARLLAAIRANNNDAAPQ